jgi:hypothetical protein
VLVTDDDCINYITDKLLWSWTDQVAYTELTTEVGNDKFVVTNLPKQFDKDTSHEDCMKELTDNFVNKKTVDCEMAGNNKDNDPLSKGTLPPIGKEQQQGENGTDHQGKTDASMSDGSQEQSKPGGSFSPTDQNDKMSGLPPEKMKSHEELLDTVAAALKGIAAGDDSPAGQQTIEHPEGDDSAEGQKQIVPPEGDDSSAGPQKPIEPAEEPIEPPKRDDSPAGPQKPIEPPEEPIEPPKGDDSPEDQVEESGKLPPPKNQEVNKNGNKGELDQRRSKGKKQQIFGNDKEGKLPPKKGNMIYV